MEPARNTYIKKETHNELEKERHIEIKK